METKANPNPAGCLARALPDEPFLVLLARDKAAPDTIRFWADRRAQMGVEEEIDQDAEQLSEALTTADAMEAWRIAHDGEWRGVPPTSLEQLSPSAEATSLAGRILSRGSPLDDKKLMHDLEMALIDPRTSRDRERVGALLRQALDPYFKDTHSLAGALLRLDPEVGQGVDGD